MNNNIEKITIESLFQSETETLYVILRQRAIEAKMLEAEFHEMFIAARRRGDIEFDAIGNVTLMGDIEPPKKPRYETNMGAMTKHVNSLCTAVIIEMTHIYQTASTASDTIEVWEKRLRDSIEANALIYTRCSAPTVSKWDNRRGKCFVAAYASASTCVSSSAFITISVSVQED